MVTYNTAGNNEIQLDIVIPMQKAMNMNKSSVMCGCAPQAHYSLSLFISSLVQVLIFHLWLVEAREKPANDVLGAINSINKAQIITIMQGAGRVFALGRDDKSDAAQAE